MSSADVGSALTAHLESAQRILAQYHSDAVRLVARSWYMADTESPTCDAEVARCNADTDVQQTKVTRLDGYFATYRPKSAPAIAFAEKFSKESLEDIETNSKDCLQTPLRVSAFGEFASQDTEKQCPNGHRLSVESINRVILPGALPAGDEGTLVDGVPCPPANEECPVLPPRHSQGGFTLLSVWDPTQSKAALYGFFSDSQKFKGLSRTRSNLSSASRSRTSGKRNAITSNQSEHSVTERHSLQIGNASSPQDVLKVFIHQLLLHPHSPRRAFWDLFSFALVFYDVVFIPLQLFDPPVTTFSEVMGWIARIFWTLDLPVQFLSGYVTHDGYIEMRFRYIVRKYVRTWFVLDAFIVIVEWAEMISAGVSGMSYAKAAKASRTFRIIRMVRLLRLARMNEVLELITERINSEKLVIIADVLKMVVILIGVAHFVACIWYAIGAKDGPDTWVATYMYTEKPVEARYFMSLHWSLSQFAGGMDEITAKNTGERFFNIVVFVWSFVAATVFIGSLTSSMTQLQLIGSQQKQEILTLKRYLAQNGISSRLAIRVQRNATHTISEQQRLMPEDHVKLLKMVSEPMKIELHFEMYSPVLSQHPFFHQYIAECPQVLRKVCHLALSKITVSCGDVVFTIGEMPDPARMYFVLGGTLSYYLNEFSSSNLQKNDWIAEPVLWVQWMHRGVLKAVTDCNLCAIDAKVFQTVVGQFSHDTFDPREYAASFVQRLNSLEGELTDRTIENTSEEKRHEPLFRLKSTIRKP